MKARGKYGKTYGRSLRLPHRRTNQLGFNQKFEPPTLLLGDVRREADAEADLVGLVDDLPPERDDAARQQQLDPDQLAPLDADVFGEDEAAGGADVGDRPVAPRPRALPARAYVHLEALGQAPLIPHIQTP